MCDNWLKALTLSIALTLESGAVAGCVPGPELDFDPLERYRNGITFDVTRNGEPVGRAETRFSRDDAGLKVDARLDLHVRAYLLFTFDYHYTATERWCGGRLVRLDATVDENGKVRRTTAELVDNAIEVSGPKGEATAAADTYPSNHWHPGVLQDDTVINTLNGEVAMVEIRDCGRDTVMANGAPRAARCFEYTGQIRARTWYDDADRWVKLAFTAKDGSKIEYHCVECGADRSTQSSSAVSG